MRFRTAAFGSLSSITVADGKDSEQRGVFEVHPEAEAARSVWIEVADKVRREYGFGSGAQPAKVLQVVILV